MTVTDALLRKGLDTTRPVLERLGILASPITELLDARRTLTVDRSPEEVVAVLAEEANSSRLFAAGAVVRQAGRSPQRFEWDLPGRGQATAQVHPGQRGETVVALEVHLDRPTDHSRPRYAHNAGVVALRCLHRLKSLVETGEMPTLAANPAARDAPDPYSD